MNTADMEGLRKNEPLGTHTTLNIGGPAEYFIAIKSPRELRDAVLWAKKEHLPITVLGGGSNVLVDDAGVEGLVIQNKIAEIHQHVGDEEVLLTVGGGAVFDEVVKTAVENGWTGIENLSGIPGSVGATPIQNVGAYGTEVSERVIAVIAYNPHTDTFEIFDANRCGFRYRHSIFKRKEYNDYVVVYVIFKLGTEFVPNLEYKDLAQYFETAPEPSLKEVREAVLEIRSTKFPDWTKEGTAGSFFKNPIIPKNEFERIAKRYPDLPGFPLGDDKVKIPLGWILDHVLNLRGHSDGTVGLFERQALVLVNHGGATAGDVTTLAKKIEALVYDATNITIEWEVTKI